MFPIDAHFAAFLLVFVSLNKKYENDFKSNKINFSKNNLE